MPKRLDLILYDALVESGSVLKVTLDTLLKECDTKGLSLQELLIRQGLIREKEALNIYAQKLKLSFLSLRETQVEKSVIDKVPVKIATYYRFLPVQLKARALLIAVSGPLDIKTQDEIRTQLGLDIEIALATQDDINESLKKYYGLAADTLERIVSEVGQGKEAIFSTVQEKVEDIEKLAGDASVIKLVNQIILDAYRKRSTDIHIEPFRDSLALRYRVDGLLYEATVPPEIKNFLNAIISRIKIMSNLDIVERRLPQDGRAVVKVQDQVLDLRISTIPTPYGESVVIRILPTQMLFNLQKLGLAKRDLLTFEKLILKPHGIIFVTGPTGSGKTTTLYASLNRINTKERKIITIEDPIEYEMQGITQIQVMPEIGLDFARGLRSMLRHDPDVMMVGEVRDLETAEIAIRVALTGHLVFSTLHTNDAASGITRLVDIGVEPYLVASSVEAFIAQRLIRVICSDCKYEEKEAPVELKELIARDLKLKSIEEVKLYRGKGCPNCNQTGFFGRTAIYEILLVDEIMQDLIIKKASASQIKKQAVSKGMQTLRQDGWRKVILGVTTPEEVMNVTASEDNPGTGANAAPAGSQYQQELSQPQGHIDRRIYKRLSNKVNLHYNIFNPANTQLKKGFMPEQLSVTKNISAGGILFISQEAFLPGELIELKIELPDGQEAVECLSRVVRAEEEGTGGNFTIAVCFLDITSAQRSRLDKYVEEEN